MKKYIIFSLIATAVIIALLSCIWLVAWVVMNLLGLMFYSFTVFITVFIILWLSIFIFSKNNGIHY